MLVYKSEPYVEKSLRSALEQTFESLEIIIVNDCTPDGAMAVVDRVLLDYPARRPHVKIIDQPVNMGTAAARQTAIDNAVGEYTIHLDSDDWVEPDMVEQMYECAKRDDADIVVCDLYVEFPDRRVYHSSAPVPSSGKEYFRALIRQDRSVGMCNQLIRRSLYTDNNIGWTPGLNLREDLLITMKLAIFADRVSYLPKAFLHYFKGNPNSITSVLLTIVGDQMTRVMADIERFLNAQPDPAEYAEDIFYHKLLTRRTLLRFARGSERKKIARLYLEVPRRYILSQPGVPLRKRISDYLISLLACRRSD